MEEKIALVTGASRGIGSQIAKTLAKKNIFVVVNYSGSKEKAEQTAEEIINAGGKFMKFINRNTTNDEDESSENINE